MVVEDSKRELLDRHLELVLEANSHTNLTRITDWKKGQLLHIEDSLMGIPEVEAAPEGSLADIGSGAGYPGIPLAIMTGRQTTLVESVGKKATLLSHFVDELGLNDQVDVYSCRVEEISKKEEKFSVVTARALSSLPSLMELASPLLKQNGRLVCYKSVDIYEEMNNAMLLQEKLAMQFVSLREVELSDGKTKRSIIVFEKKGEPTVTLPRNIGKAQKNPYKK